jgi:hypothetical protein
MHAKQIGYSSVRTIPVLFFFPDNQSNLEFRKRLTWLHCLAPDESNTQAKQKSACINIVIFLTITIAI